MPLELMERCSTRSTAAPGRELQEDGQESGHSTDSIRRPKSPGPKSMKSKGSRPNPVPPDAGTAGGEAQAPHSALCHTSHLPEGSRRDLLESEVLFIEDLVRILRTSRSTIERRRAAGTFPIPELPSIDSRPRWSRRAVQDFLAKSAAGLRPRNFRHARKVAA